MERSGLYAHIQMLFSQKEIIVETFRNALHFFGCSAHHLLPSSFFLQALKSLAHIASPQNARREKKESRTHFFARVRGGREKLLRNYCAKKEEGKTYFFFEDFSYFFRCARMTDEERGQQQRARYMCGKGP